MVPKSTYIRLCKYLLMVAKDGYHRIGFAPRIQEEVRGLNTSYSFTEFVHMAVREAIDARKRHADQVPNCEVTS